MSRYETRRFLHVYQQRSAARKAWANAIMEAPDGEQVICDAQRLTIIYADRSVRYYTIALREDMDGIKGQQFNGIECHARFDADVMAFLKSLVKG